MLTDSTPPASEGLGLPAIPDLRLRPFTDSRDVPGLFAVRQAAAVADQADPHSSREALPTLTAMQQAYAGTLPGDTVVGVVLTAIEAAVGKINEVAVRPAWQRRGIAQVLMTAAVTDLQTRGVREIRLFTDAANGQNARSLYERVGFREVKQHGCWRKAFR